MQVFALKKLKGNVKFPKQISDKNLKGGKA